MTDREADIRAEFAKLRELEDRLALMRKLGTCRHGIPTTDPDAANCAYYEDPENLRPAGPAHRRKEK